MSEIAEKTLPTARTTRSCKVHEMASLHPRLRANDWRSPLVHRVLGSTAYKDGNADVAVDYKWLEKRLSSPVTLLWEGLATDFDQCLASYQAPVLTEFATLGLACVLVHLFPALEITEVTRRGEKADYWIGEKECMLEVSGQQAGNLDNLRDEKAKQLLSNPFGKPGFVCVAVYDERKSYLWFYEVNHGSL
jgi:hypothetical protein